MFAHPTDQLRHPGGTQIPRPKRPEHQRQRPAPTTGYSLESRKERFQMADKQMIEELEAEQSMFVLERSPPALTGQAACFCSWSWASSQVWRTSDGVR